MSDHIILYLSRNLLENQEIMSNSPNSSNAVVNLLSKVRLVRKAALAWDRYRQSNGRANLYQSRLFKTDIDPQRDSPLLMLPAELRWMIYEYVLTPPFDEGSMKALALLATCQLINAEAIHLALRKTYFRINSDRNPPLAQNLWALGPLHQHLRHLNIGMPILKLDHAGKNNPFLLMELPLSHFHLYLHVSEEDALLNVRRLAGTQLRREVWATFLSALLYRACHDLEHENCDSLEPTNHSRKVSSSFWMRTLRQVEVSNLAYAPTNRDLFKMLWYLQAKEVEITTNYPSLWLAFWRYDLMAIFQGELIVDIKPMSEDHPEVDPPISINIRKSISRYMTSQYQETIKIRVEEIEGNDTRFEEIRDDDSNTTEF